MYHSSAPPPREEGSDWDFKFLARKVQDGVPYERAIKLLYPPVSLEWCIRMEDRVKYYVKYGKYPTSKLSE